MTNTKTLGTRLSNTQQGSSRERKNHGNKDKEGDRAGPEDEAEAEAEAEMTGRDSHPDGRKEEAQAQDQVQEEDGTGNGKELATQGGMTTATTDHSPTNGRTGADPEKQTQQVRTRKEYA